METSLSLSLSLSATQAGVAGLALGQVASLERLILSTTTKDGTVLVSGAGGTVGIYAVPYASQAGYTAVATANLSTAAKKEQVKTLGASHMINFISPLRDGRRAEVSRSLHSCPRHLTSKHIIHSIGPDRQNVPDEWRLPQQ